MLTPAFSTFESGRRFIAIKLYISAERNRADAIIGMAAFESPDARTEAKE